jgi:putative oxidoreductase
MKNLLSPLSEFSYLLLRLITGALFAFHGIQKIFGVLTDAQPPVGSQLWIGGLLELVCGAAIALGLFTSLAAFLASGEMAVAYSQFHWQMRFDENFFPAVNKGELAVVYCFVFLFIACRGGGAWSFDNRSRTTSS